MSNTTYRTFDPYTCQLSGRNMVTAGAGTGKTYSIQILFLRMILAGMPVTQILVVTFTNLATDELRNRLRKILQDALDACCRLMALDDGAYATVLQEKAFAQVSPCFAGMNAAGVSKAYQLLTDAARDFDAAPISTIHGFCSRILKENAFDSGVRYGLEMRSSMKALTKQLASRFWRRFSEEPTPRRQLALRLLEFTPDVLVEDLNDIFGNPDVTIQWNAELPSVEAAQDVVRCIEEHPLWTSLPASLEACSEDDIDTLDALSNALKADGTQAFSRSSLKYWRTLGDDVMLAAMPSLEGAYKSLMKTYTDDCKKSGKNPTSSGQEEFLKCDGDILGHLGNSKKKDEIAKCMSRLASSESAGKLAHAILDVLRLRNLLETYRTCVRFIAYQDIDANIACVKSRDGFMTYDDLLLILSRRLADGTVGERLRAIIRKQYTAVIVDEFQDTDAHQSAIFNALLSGDDDQDAGRTYFMIGDEKQAIYMFRGGDVYTFYAEKEKCGGNVYSLTKNFRSSTAFINAMNDFWQTHRDFFEPDSTICFEHIDDPALDMASPARRHLELLHNGQPMRDRLLRFAHPSDGNTVNDVLHQWIRSFASPEYAFEKIVEEGGTRDVSVNAVSYSDIAVLVRAKKSGASLRDYLREHGVPAVLLKTQSVFKMGEAGQLYLIMDAILHPGDSHRAMRVLLERLLALPIEKTDDIRARSLPVFQMALKQLLDEWQKTSFIAMIHQLLKMSLDELLGAGTVFDGAQGQQTVSARIASVSSTDTLSLFLQAVYYLHTVAMEQHLGPVGLADFLYTRCVVRKEDGAFGDADRADTSTIDEMDDDDELYPACLPTQDDAVKILTIHASKGLQFPIVLVDQFTSKQTLPFEDRIFHDKDRRRVINMTGQDSGFGRKCVEEHIAEDRRLMYVAITRAQYCCWFCSEQSSYAVPANADGKVDAARDNARRHPELLLQTEGQLQGMDGGEPLDKLPEIPQAPREEQMPPLQKFTLKSDGLPPGWVTTSFSELSRGHREDSPKEKTDDDQDEQLAADDFMQTKPFSDKVPFDERETIFQFMGGKRTGTCWHEIFEKLDFTLLGDDVSGRETDIAEQNAMIVDALDSYGQLGNGDKRAARLDAFMEMLRRVVTHRVQIDGDAPWRLVDVPKERCLHECEFTYQFRQSKNGEDFRKILSKYVSAELLRPDWQHGFSVHQMFTGSLDLLFMNPREDKYIIVDWKTNILDANPASFTVEGVALEMREHVYILQCILYAVAFVQYYVALAAAGKPMDAALRRSLVEEAYGHFGGCVDMFVRGVKEVAGREYGVFTYKPPLGLLLELDECCGVTLNLNGRGGQCDE